MTNKKLIESAKKLSKLEGVSISVEGKDLHIIIDSPTLGFEYGSRDVLFCIETPNAEFIRSNPSCNCAKLALVTELLTPIVLEARSCFIVI